jgi:hypothetical protein
VRDGQPSPHRPRLVVSRSTCPPISPPPHVNSFVLGPAVINTHSSTIMWSCRGPEGTKSAVSREVFLGPVVCPLTMAHKVWRIGFDQVCEVLPGNALPHTTQGVQSRGTVHSLIHDLNKNKAKNNRSCVHCWSRQCFTTWMPKRMRPLRAWCGRTHSYCSSREPR